MIDYRSDTVTRPTEAMKEAMLKAQVGDDVFGEDPSINALQDFAADYFGKEAALFCPSGTMTNQIAINLHTRPGDEVICSTVSHVYLYEGGGIAKNSGASVRLLDGDRGRLSATEIADNVNRRTDVHLPNTSLVCVEDTVNKGGGCYYELAAIKDIRKVCDAHDLALHLDGARVFNALVETGVSPVQYASHFHTLSVCLSKGLGAPVGSLLIGSAAYILKARRIRKVLGGGMRQAGILAAAGLYALEHHVERLKEDHAKARRLAEALKKCRWVKDVDPVQTNILLFKTYPENGAEDVVKRLAQVGILGFPFGKEKVRWVTHLDISETNIQETLQLLARHADELPALSKH
jgi:threonine aldolase